jgi:uncharacterized protein
MATTTISTIQGSTLTSPLVSQTVAVEGVVTSNVQGTTQLSGFFIQQAVPDGNPETSDGIFVFAPNNTTTIAVGDYVQVKGTVAEFGGSTAAPTNSATQISSVTSVQVCGTYTVPTPISISLPLATSTALEKYEGMLVRFEGLLNVSETFSQGRFGELVLSSGRQFHPNNGNVSVTSVQNQLGRIILDDASNVQNPSPTPWMSAAGSAGTRRVGDSVQNLTGILSYGFNAYRLQPTATPTFTVANPRSDTPPAVGGTLKVSSFNVLNYFTTLNQRGANTSAEFTRQKDKIVSAIVAIDADVLGLMEIENNSDTALNDLVAAINARIGTTTYAPVRAGIVGTDAIKTAIIYKPATAQPIGNPVLPTGADLAAFAQARPPQAQRFAAASNNGSFWFIVNHFKSKGSCPTSGDIDLGQGCWNVLRTTQANALNNFATSLRTNSGENDVLMMGDFNNYLLEDPAKALETAGFENLLNTRVPAAQRYTYVFSGETGALDHAYASAGLGTQVAGVNVWHINSDEPPVLDYNLENKNDDRYAATPFRSSDHDPIIVGLNLNADTVASQPLLSANIPATSRAGTPTVITDLLATPSNGNTAQSLQINWGDGTTPQSISTTATTAAYTYTAAGTYTLTISFADSASRIATKTGQVVVSAAPPPVPDLFFSEYVEGSSNNKALEIYNPTTATVDLSAYTIKLYSNGSTGAGSSLTLTGTLGAGQVYVLAHASGTATLTATANLLVASGILNFNGDDAITLEKSGIVIDRIGQVGFDPGTEWGASPQTTLNATLRRKSGINIGDSNATSTFLPSSQWDGFPTDTFTGLGTHTP